jgi:uncharacterized membrane protein YfhO
VAAVDEREALAQLFDPALPAETVVLTGGPATDDVGRATVTVDAAPGHYRTTVESDSPGYLRVLESAYPGWVATIDGQPAKIFTADGIFLGVAVPAGQHAVELSYRPGSLLLGAAISGVGLVVVIGLVAAPALRRRLL